MVSVRRFLVAAVATMMFASACSTTGSLQTIPPITLPSGLAGFTLPPGVLPSGDPNAGLCPLVSPGEMSDALGAQVTVRSATASNCIYTLPTLSAVTISESTGVDLTAAKAAMGDSAQPVTFGSYQGYAGTVAGQPTVYVQGTGKQLGLIWALGGNDPANVQKLVTVAQIAAGRWH